MGRDTASVSEFVSKTKWARDSLQSSSAFSFFWNPHPKANEQEIRYEPL